jgi:hypothetical protein
MFVVSNNGMQSNKKKEHSSKPEVMSEQMLQTRK